MPTTDELQASVDALTARVVALESWIDSVIPTVRGLVRARGTHPGFDASGTPVAINYPLPEGSEEPETRAAVPQRPAA